VNKSFIGEAAREYDKWFLKGFGKSAFNLEKRLITKYIPKISNILDIGCGTGIWMELFNELGIETFGLDISRDMLEVAVQKGFKNVVLGRAERLPFKDNSFQASSFITSLEFMENREAALKEALRVSEKYILIAFLNKFSLLSIYRSLKAAVSKSIYRKARFLTYGELLKLSRNLNVDGKYIRPILNRGTIRLAFGNFINEDLENLIPDNFPLPAFNLTIFQVKRI